MKTKQKTKHRNDDEGFKTLAEKIVKSATIVSADSRSRNIEAIKANLRAAFTEVTIGIENHPNANVKAQGGLMRRLYENRTYAAFLCRSINWSLTPELQARGINMHLADRLRTVLKVLVLYDHKLARSLQEIYDTDR